MLGRTFIELSCPKCKYNLTRCKKCKKEICIRCNDCCTSCFKLNIYKCANCCVRCEACNILCCHSCIHVIKCTCKNTNVCANCYWLSRRTECCGINICHKCDVASLNIIICDHCSAYVCNNQTCIADHNMTCKPLQISTDKMIIFEGYATNRKLRLMFDDEQYDKLSKSHISIYTNFVLYILCDDISGIWYVYDRRYHLQTINDSIALELNIAHKQMIDRRVKMIIDKCLMLRHVLLIEVAAIIAHLLLYVHEWANNDNILLHGKCINDNKVLLIFEFNS